MHLCSHVNVTFQTRADLWVFLASADTKTITDDIVYNTWPD